MSVKLTNNDLIAAADRLDCEVAAIRAVDEVESNGNGFDAQDRVIIRFETAWFKRYTGITVAGSDRVAFNKAYALNPEAAMLSTSWGRYQIMGFNYELVGYDSVTAFVDAMKVSEGKHLDAFLTFVEKKGLVKALQTHDWAAFAYKYNGSNYRAGKYDTKIAAAYKKYAGQVITPETAKEAVVVKKKFTLSAELVFGAVLLLVFGAGYALYFSGRADTVLYYVRSKFPRLRPARVRRA